MNITSVHPGGIKTNIVRNARFSEENISDKTTQKKIEEFDRLAGTTPEKAASIIIRGMPKNRKRQLVGVDAIVIDILCRLLPQGFSDLIGFLYERRERVNTGT